MSTNPKTCATLPAVLIVEDDALLRRALRRLLHGLDLELHEVGSGQAALTWIEKHEQVAAIITGHLGAGPTGLEVLEQAQHRYPGVAAFLYTGGGLLTVEVWREAFVTIIAKPAPAGRLRAIVQGVRP